MIKRVRSAYAPRQHQHVNAKVIVANIISVDGFYSGPNDDVMAMPVDTPFSDNNLERLRAADTLFLGRRSFQGFRDYWPPIADTRSSHR